MKEDVVRRLRKLCARNDRKGILELFDTVPEQFSSITLPPSKVSVVQAVNDLTREQVVLNGVLFSDPKIFIPALTRVAKVLTRDPSYSGTTCASDVVESVMRKASRTTSGYASYTSIAALFVTEKYLLTPRTEDAPPPIQIQLLLIQGSIQSSVSCINYYSLVEHPDGENGIGCDSQLPRVWLKLDTVVVEKTDYVTGRGARYLSIDLVHAEEQDEDVTTVPIDLQPPKKMRPLHRRRSHRKSVCEILLLNEMDGKEIENEEELGICNWADE